MLTTMKSTAVTHELLDSAFELRYTDAFLSTFNCFHIKRHSGQLPNKALQILICFCLTSLLDIVLRVCANVNN